MEEWRELELLRAAPNIASEKIAYQSKNALKSLAPEALSGSPLGELTTLPQTTALLLLLLVCPVLDTDCRLVVIAYTCSSSSVGLLDQ